MNLLHKQKRMKRAQELQESGRAETKREAEKRNKLQREEEEQTVRAVSGKRDDDVTLEENK